MRQVPLTVTDFLAMKQAKQKISLLTSYDYWSAKMLNSSPIDALLVGDSLAMVMYGHDSTVHATLPMMLRHIEAVRRGAPDKFIIGDLPFLSYRKDLADAVAAAGACLQAGAQAVKLEGVLGNQATIGHLVESGIPVMGHLGLTPQAVHQLGGFKVQGKTADQAQKLIKQCQQIQACGCFALVLECVPAALAAEIAAQLTIPVIGIGAGVAVDGQILVLHDLLGLISEFKPRFVKQYLNGSGQISAAISEYDQQVRDGLFPSEQQAF